MKNTRLFSRVFCASVLIVLLVSCAPLPVTRVVPTSANPGTPAFTLVPTSTRTPTPASTPTSLPHLKVTAADLQGITVWFIHPFAGAVRQQLETFVSEFNSTNEWGVQVVAEAAGSQTALHSMVDTAFREVALPHVLAAPVQDLAAWQDQYNSFVDLNPYVADPVWGLSEYVLGGISPALWAQDIVNGTRLGVPAERTAHVLFYNASWAQELGFDAPPATPDEFREQACAAAQVNRASTDADIRGTGGWIINTGAEANLAWLHAFGATGIPDPASGVFTFNSTESVAALTFLRGMFDTGCAWVSRLPEPYGYFANRQALFYSGTLEDSAMQEAAMRRLGAADDWQLLPYPVLEGQPVVLAGGPSYAITVSSPAEQMAAWVFIRWMLDPARQADMVEAGPSMPLGAGVEGELGAYPFEHTRWAASLDWADFLQTTPAMGAWRVGREVLADAAWQMYQVNLGVDDIPGILSEVDALILEVTSR